VPSKVHVSRDQVGAVLGVALALAIIGLVALRATDGARAARATTAPSTPQQTIGTSSGVSASPARVPFGHIDEPVAPVAERHPAPRHHVRHHPRHHTEKKPHPSHSAKRHHKARHRHHHHHRRHHHAAVQPTVIPAAQFQVASLNVLGASHTARHGNKHHFASGATRMRYSVQLLRSHGVDVVGLQEFEVTQFAAFKRATGSAFATFPGPTMGHNPVRNSIAWRTDTWSLVAAHTESIPYFHGHRVPMPYVLLQHRTTGRKVWFMNVHNPASTKSHGNNQRWRNVATGIEIATVHRLQATGIPVVFTGDFNERAESFCRITAATELHAANGGSTSGPCHPPANNGIDWIFGSPSVSFSGYVRQGQGLVNRATDHPLIVATAQVGG
jgi:hypothetical protein